MTDKSQQWWHLQSGARGGMQGKKKPEEGGNEGEEVMEGG